MFVDQAKIHIRAGKGGDGKVSFRREKYVPSGGPDGGDGGRGGSIIAIVDEGMRTLMDFRYKTKYLAEDGENGMMKKMYGKNSENLILKVPPGTLVRDADSGAVLADLTEKGQKAVLARGGKGGRGNTWFKSPTRQAPDFSEPGFKGEERNVIFELKMLADVGLLGYPNVGKSTILSVVTKAKPKIANYHFTTLKPNLGVCEAVRGKGFVMADIPGLIEGASEGVGIGHDFLRHVERTRMLIHVVDISGSEGREPLRDFEQINRELEQYSPRLAAREQVVVANKTDLMADDSVYEEFRTTLEAKGYKVFPVSAATLQGLDAVMLYVTERLDFIPPVELDEPDLVKEPVQKGKLITIRKEADVYILEGYNLERLMFSVNPEDMDSMRHFENQLRKRGIFDTLKEMGIQDGDTVRIYDFEFEFYD